MTIFDSSGIEAFVTENNPKYANRIIRQLKVYAKAQELADKYDSKKLCRHLDAFAKSINPFLNTVHNTFGQGYYWCVNQVQQRQDV